MPLVRGNIFVLLQALVEDPVASFNKLAKKIGISPSTARELYKRLLREKYISLVFAIVNYPALEREIVAALITSPPQKWPLLESSLDEFFYIRSRARCIGSVSGIHAFFAIPSGSLPYLREFLESLRDLGLMESYKLITPASRWFYSEPDFTIFDPLTFTWKADWKSWKEMLTSLQPEHIGAPSPSILSELTLSDLKIIDILSIDARVKKSEVAKFAGLKSYELSRRLKFLHEKKVILKYRVSLGSRFLANLVNIAINAECSSKFTRLIAAAVKKLPYQSTFIPTKEGFLLYILMPSKDFIDLSAVLQEYCNRLEVTWLDYKHSKLWNIAFESYKEGKWDSSYEFMVEKPLEAIRRNISTIKI
ncbi:MAG: hypothetical protein DRJ47_03085 [Thermoprotei archaeon]|mgnify:CR=1 FL=1|nr:MAG: hypothetical protein DRJ47_03085 [Thermoprotei archaeon]